MVKTPLKYKSYIRPNRLDRVTCFFCYSLWLEYIFPVFMTVANRSSNSSSSSRRQQTTAKILSHLLKGTRQVFQCTDKISYILPVEWLFLPRVIYPLLVHSTFFYLLFVCIFFSPCYELFFICCRKHERFRRFKRLIVFLA